MSNFTYKTAEIQIAQQGAVRVNSALIFREASNIACIDLDLHSKYADVIAYQDQNSEYPTLCLLANEQTLYWDKTQPREKMTIINLVGFPKWKLYLYDTATISDSVRLVIIAPVPQEEC